MQRTAKLPHNGNPPFSMLRLKTSGYLDEPFVDFLALKQSISNDVKVARLSNVDLSDNGTGRLLASPGFSRGLKTVSIACHF